MCGIAGVFHYRDPERPIELGLLSAMTASLAHRGPDGQGVWSAPGIGLGHRRLAIIDLSDDGRQPMADSSGDYLVTFNGEIYNYRELRRGLLERGHRFKTQADGEVIAHLYEERGVEFVRELNGMFAIALWDNGARRLVLARDRAGEKPLFYWLKNDTLVFASEIKALLEYPDISRELDPEAISQYFFYGYFPAPRSVYAEIKKLPAAHVLVAEAGQIRQETYWRLSDHLRPPGLPPVSNRAERDLIEELRMRLREAAISRLVSDNRL